MISGTGIVIVLYLGVNVAFLKTMSVAGLAAAARPAQVASLVLFGAGATLLLSGAIVAMAIGSASAAVVPPARIAYAMARDGVLPATFGRVHPRFRTPALSIAVFAVWTSILCLSGRYDQLFTYATFAMILAYVAAGVSIFVFRRKRPDAERPYRCWGYPWTPCSSSGARSRSRSRRSRLTEGDALGACDHGRRNSVLLLDAAEDKRQRRLD